MRAHRGGSRPRRGSPRRCPRWHRSPRPECHRPPRLQRPAGPASPRRWRDQGAGRLLYGVSYVVGPFMMQRHLCGRFAPAPLRMPGGALPPPCDYVHVARQCQECLVSSDAEVPAGILSFGPGHADEPWDRGNGIIGAVQMTANPPAGPLRWLLLGLTGALLVVGIVGAATVDNDSDSTE